MLLERGRSPSPRERHGRRLLQAGPRPHLRRHHHALRRRRAGRPGHRRRRAAPGRPARRHRRARRSSSDLQAATPATSNAGALRPDRRGARAAPPAHRRGRRDRRDRLRPARRRHQGASTRPSRWCSRSPERRVTDSMAPIHDLLDDNLDRLEAALRAGRRRSPAPPPASSTSTSSSPGCSPAPSSSSAPAPPWARPSFALAWPPTPRSRPDRAGACSSRSR